MAKRQLERTQKKRGILPRKWPLAVLLGALAAIVVSRGRSVISAAPKKSKAAVQEIATDVRTMFGKDEFAETPQNGRTESAPVSDPADITVPATELSIADTDAVFGDAPVNEPIPEPAEASAAPAEGPAPAASPTTAEETTAPTPPATTEAGVDETGIFRPTKAETDEFGVVVTDNEPTGLQATENWVKGDGTSACPDGYPVKGNASSRIYHQPGQPSYDQTIAEICFADEGAAAQAGYRPRKG